MALYSLWNSYLSDIQFGAEVQTVPYQVEQGDSLWSIASGIDPNNTGDITYQIQELNDISSGYLHPGMVIQVPTK